MNIFERARDAWMVFRGRDRPVKDWSSPDSWGSGQQVTQFDPYRNGGGWNGSSYGPSSADRPDRVALSSVSAKTVLASIYTRIALDFAKVEFHHAYVDENDNMKDSIPGSLEEVLVLEPNIDQNAFQYSIDLIISMFNEPKGIVAEVPISFDKDEDGSFTDEEPIQYRTGKVTRWFPQEVEVDVLNDMTGQHERVKMNKREVCIHENPFYQVMNKDNSLAKRLARKMSLLDKIDDDLGSDKLNAIVQLPYIVRGDVKKAQAKTRLKDLEQDMKSSSLGLGFIDGTEKIIQLNRPLGQGLQEQIQWMTEELMSQLSITKEIMNGEADPKVMANYLERCIGSLCRPIALERTRKMLSKAQRDNGERIVFVQDPFKLIPITELADLMDKSIRGAILSPNDWRGIIGYKPSNDPSANMLVNRNMPMDQTPGAADANDEEVPVQNDNQPQSIQQSAIPVLNRQQRRHMDRSKIPRLKSG